MLFKNMSPAYRRYQWLTAVAMAIYIIAVIGVDRIMHHQHPAGAGRYLLALLPAFPLIAVFVALGRYVIEERDEYLRMLVVRRILLATAGTLAMTTILGSLEVYAIVAMKPMFWTASIWFLLFGLADLPARLMRS